MYIYIHIYTTTRYCTLPRGISFPDEDLDGLEVAVKQPYTNTSK